MADDERAKALRSAAARAFAKPFGALLEIAPEGGASFFVDGRKNPPAIRQTAPKNQKPACTWRAAEDVLLRVFGGERALESAYVSGRLLISGDMSVMARIEMAAR